MDKLMCHFAAVISLVRHPSKGWFEHEERTTIEGRFRENSGEKLQAELVRNTGLATK
jgi:hypothetical protein